MGISKAYFSSSLLDLLILIQISQNNYLVEIEQDGTNPSKPTVTGKITDFGLSSILGLESDTESSLVSLAVKWQAPEMARLSNKDIKSRRKYLEKADVWSFGLTALEVALLYLIKGSLIHLGFPCR
jgi:serine/threonine protein kinase